MLKSKTPQKETAKIIDFQAWKESHPKQKTARETFEDLSKNWSDYQREKDEMMFQKAWKNVHEKRRKERVFYYSVLAAIALPLIGVALFFVRGQFL